MFVSCFALPLLWSLQVTDFTVDAIEPRNGTGAVRFGGILILAAAATLCKEVGVTVFLLVGGAELVDFLEETGFGLSRARAAARSIKGDMDFERSEPRSRQ